MAMPPENHDCWLMGTSCWRTEDSVCKVACGFAIADFSHAELTGRSSLPKVSSAINVGCCTPDIVYATLASLRHAIFYRRIWRRPHHHVPNLPPGIYTHSA